MYNIRVYSLAKKDGAYYQRIDDAAEDDGGDIQTAKIGIRIMPWVVGDINIIHNLLDINHERDGKHRADGIIIRKHSEDTGYDIGNRKRCRR